MTQVPRSDSVCAPAAHAELPDSSAQTTVASTGTTRPVPRIIPPALSRLPAFLVPAFGDRFLGSPQ
ncbi:hypothetical protein [Caballeronia mineralivorans]|uniref:hypothetical protein n=1 Tax=Caballeronia mineralivorans TaxID=2010198 RepID=UPI00128B4781|nr:hypothetical protein [Caballeronia mineralivorans]